MISDVPAKLRLSARMKAKRIHDSFHVSLVKRNTPDTCERTKKPATIQFVDGHEEYEVEAILNIEKKKLNSIPTQVDELDRSQNFSRKREEPRKRLRYIVQVQSIKTKDFPEFGCSDSALIKTYRNFLTLNHSRNT